METTHFEEKERKKKEWKCFSDMDTEARVGIKFSPIARKLCQPQQPWVICSFSMNSYKQPKSPLQSQVSLLIACCPCKSYAWTPWKLGEAQWNIIWLLNLYLFCIYHSILYFVCSCVYWGCWPWGLTVLLYKNLLNNCWTRK